MAPHFCWFLELLFLLLMMALAARSVDARPASATPPSELIAGNEFLKLFLERDELHSGEREGEGEGARGIARHMTENYRQNAADQTTAPMGVLDSSRGEGASAGGRTMPTQHSTKRNEKRNAPADDGKQVVKLVTTGSKIVFLEEYDDNDAIVDAVARDIDLQKERGAQHTKHEARSKSGDEVKVVAVSVSSSSKRGTSPPQRERDRSNVETAGMQRHKFAETSKQHISQSDVMRQPTQRGSSSTTQAAEMTLTTTAATMSASAATNIDFVNRSHKSEFSIEEAEPLTMSQQQQQQRHATRVNGRSVSAVVARDDVDSENSASNNIQNVLAAPLVQAASTRSTVTAAAAYHGGNRNATSAHVNHQTDGDTSAPADSVDDKLLPFQTVIYHDTKESHGPQSRSISYSSLSQNVEDLHAWRHTGILAEAQRNVSESLKPLATRADMTAASTAAAAAAHQSEPAKFYSVPAKMYSEPAKFYSEPAKVYSEPAKVYGQPEKFYSEPAKVYGQPSKFYSEPAKVYSQPSKVYGEPAKTYWSQSATATATTTASPLMSAGSTTSAAPAAAKAATRRPAIVSRIAFGEAQTATAAASIELGGGDEAQTTSMPTHGHNQQQHQQQHQTHRQPTRFHSHAAAHAHSQLPQTPTLSSQSQSQPQTQPRRVLFNLDKLPYDLLNAPVQSAQHLLDPDYTNSPPAAVTYSSPRQRQCLESAFSASRLSQSRQHSSVSDEHSNQNAKGLPNRDLVKCVSKYNQPATPAAPQHITTESSHNNDDLYTPTPEQNYEIEESVSVMTNGRAHGVPTATANTMTTTRKPAGVRGTKFPSRMRFGETTGTGVGAGAGIGRGRGSEQHHHHHQQQQHHYQHTNANANVNDDGHNYDDVDDGVDLHEHDDANGDDDGDVGVGSDKGAAADDDDSKVAYVVEGRNYRKYRVEEKTDDGFIVGEYGVVDHNDGNLRGVRYTADSTINRSLIQKALLTFLKLK